MRDVITKASEVKRLLVEGWELWYLACSPGLLPGRWEMRFENMSRRVSWEAVETIQKNDQWYQENLTEVQEGKNWIYMLKQKSLRLKVV